jgi:Ferredoxin-like domain in Api92-like protein
MPNWCYNSVTIEGPKEEIAYIKAKLNEPFTRQHDQWNKETGQMEVKDFSFDNPVFAFWNIAKPSNLEAYLKQPDHSLSIQEAMLHKGDSWYDFNNREWGTKWDVAVSNDEQYPETELMEENETSLAYRFNTAWAPPTPAIEKLSVMVPNSIVSLSYEEETGWGGEMEFENGTITSNTEYGWKCRECDHEEDETPYCEECEFDTCPSCGYNESSEPCKDHEENNH